MFKNSIVAIALLATQAFAAITFTSAPAQVVAGQTYNLQWTADGTEPVTILLRQGDPANLQTVGTITSSGTGGAYSWTAPATFAPGTNYAFQITQGPATNYYGPFSYSGGTGAASAAASVAASVAAPSGSAPASVAASASAAKVSSYPTLLPSVIKNGTTTSNSTSASSTSAPSAAKPSATIVSANSAMTIGSPLALVLGAVAAMLYLQ